MNSLKHKLLIWFSVVLILFLPVSKFTVSAEPNYNWTTGLQVGSYQKSVVLEQGIDAFGGDTPGTIIVQRVTEVSDTLIKFDQNTTRPSSTEIYTTQITEERDGYSVFNAGRTRTLTTTNVTYLAELFKTNSSGILKFEVNDTHFMYSDYWLMPAHQGWPDHYHSYNATYDRITGWRTYMEVSHVHLDGELLGIVRIEGFETGIDQSYINSINASNSSPEDDSPIDTSILILTLTMLPIMKRRFSKNRKAIKI